MAALFALEIQKLEEDRPFQPNCALIGRMSRENPPGLHRGIHGRKS